MAVKTRKQQKKQNESDNGNDNVIISSSDDKYVDNCIIVNEKYAKDNRLFSGLPLYCEGRAKPYLRGVQHLLCCMILIPFMAYTLLSKYADTQLEVYSFIVFVVGSFASMGASAVFHITKFNEVQQEIFYQRLDHSAVFINVLCTYTSVALLIINNSYFNEQNSIDKTLLCNICIACIAITALGSAFGVYHVFNCYSERMSLWVGNIVLSLPSYPFISYHMTKNEQNLAIIGLISYAIGAVIFGKRLHQSKWPHIYTYHEVFHMFTVISAVCAFLVLLSLACNDRDTRCGLRWAALHEVFGHNGSFCDYQ